MADHEHNPRPAAQTTPAKSSERAVLVGQEDSISSSTKGRPLQNLHEAGYIPRLVRPRFTSRDGKDGANHVPGVEGGIRQVNEFVHFGSYGKPPTSPRHLLYMEYRTFSPFRNVSRTESRLAALEAMSDLYSLHRDVTWYHVLVHSVHHVNDGRGVMPRTCINEIMCVVSPSMPSAILIAIPGTTFSATSKCDRLGVRRPLPRENVHSSRVCC